MKTLNRLLSTRVAIIGGGPAGLCASNLLKRYNIDHMIFEAGSKVESRCKEDSYDVVHGIGGAGLYSDGKFSFYPSATRLWELNNIEESFKDIKNLLCEYGLPSNIPSQYNHYNGHNNLTLKLYSSIYLDFPTRSNLINDLQSYSINNILTQSMVTNIEPILNKYRLYLNNDNSNFIETDYIILCGGRFHSLSLLNNNWNFGDFEYQRYEFGVRIEANYDSLIWKHFTDYKNGKQNTEYKQCNDPKYKFIDTLNDNIEFRTFCYCCNGLVVETNTLGVYSYSGRADCEKTKKTNFGFNARILKDNDIIKKEIMKWKTDRCTFNEKINFNKSNNDNILSVLKSNMGYETGTVLHRGLNQLFDYFPDFRNEELSVYGPTLEGVGSYPKLLNQSLSWSYKDINNDINKKIFVAGDCTGIFRGIVASMTSGNYAARQIKNTLFK